MRNKRFNLVWGIVVLLSCQQESKSTIKNDNKDFDTTVIRILPNNPSKVGGNSNSRLTNEISTDSCHELLTLLVKSSSLDSELNALQYDVRIEEIRKGIAKLELVVYNEERNENVAISWLEMDFNKRELRDITLDPSRPINLKHDSILFRRIDDYCRVETSR